MSQRLFSLGPAVRGGAIELMRGAPNSFRFTQVVDKPIFNGTVTSLKSLNIFDRSYQNLSRLGSTLSGYVQQLANYRGGQTPSGVIRAGQITGRVLGVTLPKGNLSAGQLQVLGRIQQEAARQGVRVVYVQPK